MENKKTGYPHIDKPWMKFYPKYKQKEYPKINLTDMSSRQIPSKFVFKQILPLTKNSKVNYNLLTNEAFDGNEINVKITETNLSVGEIKIY